MKNKNWPKYINTDNLMVETHTMQHTAQYNTADLLIWSKERVSPTQFLKHLFHLDICKHFTLYHVSKNHNLKAHIKHRMLIHSFDLTKTKSKYGLFGSQSKRWRVYVLQTAKKKFLKLKSLKSDRNCKQDKLK